MGTSLQVQPFASLIERVSDDCPRLLINLERVGEMASDLGDASGGLMSRYAVSGFDFDGMLRGGPAHARDVLFEGKCDDGVLQLAKECGWEDELLELRDEVWAKFDKDTAQFKGPAKADAADTKPEISSDGICAGASATSAEVKADALASDLASKIKDLKVESERPADAAKKDTSRGREDSAEDASARKGLKAPKI